MSPVFLEEVGWKTVHWSHIGWLNAPDQEIFHYAKSHGYVIFTHDLDFGAILAATNADYPSVVQVRVQDVTPEHLDFPGGPFLHQKWGFKP